MKLNITGWAFMTAEKMSSAHILISHLTKKQILWFGCRLYGIVGNTMGMTAAHDTEYGGEPTLRVFAAIEGTTLAISEPSGFPATPRASSCGLTIRHHCPHHGKYRQKEDLPYDSVETMCDKNIHTTQELHARHEPGESQRADIGAKPLTKERLIDKCPVEKNFKVNTVAAE